VQADTVADWIMPEGARNIRQLAHNTCVEVLLYMSPKHSQYIVDSVAVNLNSSYLRFIRRHPNFTGKVSILAYSLGAVLCYDLLAHQAIQESSPVARELQRFLRKQEAASTLSAQATTKVLSNGSPTTEEADASREAEEGVGVPAAAKGCSVVKGLPGDGNAAEQKGGIAREQDTSQNLFQRAAKAVMSSVRVRAVTPQHGGPVLHSLDGALGAGRAESSCGEDALGGRHEVLALLEGPGSSSSGQPQAAVAATKVERQKHGMVWGLSIPFGWGRGKAASAQLGEAPPYNAVLMSDGSVVEPAVALDRVGLDEDKDADMATGDLATGGHAFEGASLGSGGLLTGANLLPSVANSDAPFNRGPDWKRPRLECGDRGGARACASAAEDNSLAAPPDSTGPSGGQVVAAVEVGDGTAQAHVAASEGLFAMQQLEEEVGAERSAAEDMSLLTDMGLRLGEMAETVDGATDRAESAASQRAAHTTALHVPPSVASLAAAAEAQVGVGGATRIASLRLRVLELQRQLKDAEQELHGLTVQSSMNAAQLEGPCSAAAAQLRECVEGLEEAKGVGDAMEIGGEAGGLEKDTADLARKLWPGSALEELENTDCQPLGSRRMHYPVRRCLGPGCVFVWLLSTVVPEGLRMLLLVGHDIPEPDATNEAVDMLVP
jgi:hypothetical protein